MYLLAIDLGTSSVKVLLTSESGRILAQAGAEYPLDHPYPTYAEQSPEQWWRATATAARAALAQIETASPSVSAIAVSGQMHGTVLLDQAGHLLAPAIIWPDRRSRRQVEEITNLIGLERLVELTGSPVATGFQAATIRWLQQERPALWRQVHTILLPKDYLRWRLAGQFATDPSDGSGSLLLDVRRRDWSDELLQALDIRREQLPLVQPADSVSGHLTARAAAVLGLSEGIPVITGAADTACSALGAGVVSRRELLVTLSTGGQLIIPASSVEVDRAGRIHTFCGALTPGEGRAGWYQMGAILSAGLSLRWLRDQVFGLAGPDAYEQMLGWAESAPAGANGLLSLPYLAGERTPHMDPQARGLFLGLSAAHGRAELVRAVLEGVALACYDAYSVLAEQGARPEQLILAGGGARSPLWRQIIADVFGLPVRRLEVADQSAMGAILLAGAGLNLFDPAETAPQWATYGEAVVPNRGRYTLYGELLDLFRAAYRKHREDFGALQRITEEGRD
jgi:xylulokinase